MGQEMRPFSLILEHRELMSAVDRLHGDVQLLLANQGEEGQVSGEAWHSALARSLGSFIRDLAAHFESESPATAAIFAEHAERELVDAWQTLEAEHSWLSHRFIGVLGRLEEVGVARYEVLHDLQLAIADFRAHEKREEALFGVR